MSGAIQRSHLLSTRVLPTAGCLVLRRGFSTTPAQGGRDYSDAIQRLNALATNASILNQLRRSPQQMNDASIPEMKELLARIGMQVSDLDALNTIHIAGTKGKGSTSAFTEAILRAHGITTGLYTSPHLIQTRERIRVNGKPVEPEDFAKCFWHVHDRLEQTKHLALAAPFPMPSYFRFVTLMSYVLLLEKKVDVMISEVGIGGMYDATNVVERPVVCGITTLGYDHMSVLGTTIESIALHKIGIAKKGVPVGSVPQVAGAVNVLQAYTAKIGAPLVFVPSLHATYSNASEATLGLTGAHQEINSSLAVWLAHHWLATKTPARFSKTNVLPKDTLTGLATCRWPGRAQELPHPQRGGVKFWLDGAHNIESLQACSLWFKSMVDIGKASNIKRVLIFNCSHDRDVQTLLQPLAALHEVHPFESVVFCPNVVAAPALSSDSDSSNNQPVDFNAQKWVEANAATWKSKTTAPSKTETFLSIDSAVEWVSGAYGDSNSCDVLVTGSLHLVGGVLRVLRCPVM